jgi:hypothetical protein
LTPRSSASGNAVSFRRQPAESDHRPVYFLFAQAVHADEPTRASPGAQAAIYDRRKFR